MDNAIKEAVRRRTALVMVIGGWLGSMGLGLWAVLSFNPAEGRFAPQWVSLGYIFLIGLAVAASTARSRMRMTDTIVGAFKAGQKIADDRWEALVRTRADVPDQLTSEFERLESQDSNGKEGM